jgi:hypothetical protein
MNRSGYSDDMDDTWGWIRYRGAVNSAINGERGQAFLRELDAALDALPEKKLIHYELESNGCFCALGAVGHARGISMADMDLDPAESSKLFGVAKALTAEIMFINDDEYIPTDGQRWIAVKNWVKQNLKVDVIV